jgi:protocatechuate 4,5-dioxygenase, alpha chain
MERQIDPMRPIVDTYVFDLARSHQGYRFNKFCMALARADNRAAFRADEAAFMERFGLSDAERALVVARDFLGMVKAGANIYLLIKLGACTGNGLYDLGAQQRGETLEQFLAGRNVGGAV